MQLASNKTRKAARLRSKRWRRAWHRPETPGATALACGSYLALDVVSAAQSCPRARGLGGQGGAKPSDVRARAEALAAALARDLERCASIQAVTARELRAI